MVINDVNLFKEEVKIQKKFVTMEYGMNDIRDVNAPHMHRRCFKKIFKLEIEKLRDDLIIPLIHDYLDFDMKDYFNKKEEEKTDQENNQYQRISKFWKYKYDYLRISYSNDNDYHILFNFLNIGQNLLYKKHSLKPIKKYMIKLLHKHEKTPIQSLIYGINNNCHCGICNKSGLNIDDNDEWIFCDGPRTDGTKIILCNQWYHNKCIKNSIRNKTSIFIQLDNNQTAFFGNRCNHCMWFDGLNQETKQNVIDNLTFINNNLNKFNKSSNSRK